MPFKSEKQRRYLYANEPEVAKRWTDKYGSKPQRNKLKASGKQKQRNRKANS